MEELYTLEGLTLREVKAIRTGLNFIQITGMDAFFMGTLQIKINEQIKEIESHISEDETTPLPPELE
jgi:hypothetical protein